MRMGVPSRYIIREVAVRYFLNSLYNFLILNGPNSFSLESLL